MVQFVAKPLVRSRPRDDMGAGYDRTYWPDPLPSQVPLQGPPDAYLEDASTLEGASPALNRSRIDSGSVLCNGRRLEKKLLLRFQLT